MDVEAQSIFISLTSSEWAEKMSDIQGTSKNSWFFEAFTAGKVYNGSQSDQRFRTHLIFICKICSHLKHHQRKFWWQSNFGGTWHQTFPADTLTFLQVNVISFIVLRLMMSETPAQNHSRALRLLGFVFN